MLVLCPNLGVQEIVHYYLTRWQVSWETGTPELTSLPPTTTMVLCDIDSVTLPPSILIQPHVRFIFLCSDSHRRALYRAGQSLCCRDYTLLNKPLKRQALWRALLRARGDQYSTPTTVMERQWQRFHDAGLQSSEHTDSSVALLRPPESDPTSVAVVTSPSAPLAPVRELEPTAPPISKPDEPVCPPSPPPPCRRILVAEDNSVNVMVCLIHPRVCVVPRQCDGWHVSFSHCLFIAVNADRHPDGVQIVKRFIAWAGCECDVASDGNKCFEMFKANRCYELIFMDCQVCACMVTSLML